MFFKAAVLAGCLNAQAEIRRIDEPVIDGRAAVVRLYHKPGGSTAPFPPHVVYQDRAGLFGDGGTTVASSI